MSDYGVACNEVGFGCDVSSIRVGGKNLTASMEAVSHDSSQPMLRDIRASASRRIRPHPINRNLDGRLDSVEIA